MKLLKYSTALCASFMVAGAAAPAHAVIIFDWVDIVTPGTTSGSGVVDGITVSYEFERFGTAAANPFLPNPEIQLGTVTGIGSPSETVILLGNENDTNPSGMLENFSQFTVSFSQSVFLDEFVIGDVDESSSGLWQDFVVVEASNLGSSVGVDYTLGSPSTQEVTTFLGVEGVAGTDEVDANPFPNNRDADFFTVTTGGAVDQISFDFLQGPNGNGNAHAVWVGPVQAQEVPFEAEGTMALVALGGYFWYRNRRKSNQA